MPAQSLTEEGASQRQISLAQNAGQTIKQLSWISTSTLTASLLSTACIELLASCLQVITFSARLIVCFIHAFVFSSRALAAILSSFGVMLGLNIHLIFSIISNIIFIPLLAINAIIATITPILTAVMPTTLITISTILILAFITATVHSLLKYFDHQRYNKKINPEEERESYLEKFWNLFVSILPGEITQALKWIANMLKKIHDQLLSLGETLLVPWGIWGAGRIIEECKPPNSDANTATSFPQRLMMRLKQLICIIFAATAASTFVMSVVDLFGFATIMALSTPLFTLICVTLAIAYLQLTLYFTRALSHGITYRNKQPAVNEPQENDINNDVTKQHTRITISTISMGITLLSIVRIALPSFKTMLLFVGFSTALALPIAIALTAIACLTILYLTIKGYCIPESPSTDQSASVSHSERAQESPEESTNYSPLLSPRT